MPGATKLSNRLLPLRIVATLVLLGGIAGLVHAVAARFELLADHPSLTEKMLATMITLTFVGIVALVFLAFLRQRFGLWIFLACAAGELALEVWAGLPLLALARIPIAAALVYASANHAWPALRKQD